MTSADPAAAAHADPASTGHVTTARHVTALRLKGLAVTRASAASPAQLLAGLGAMQAQDLPGTLWSVGLRLPDWTRADVQRALDEGTVVRTWPMRGTLHLVPALDVHWMLRLLTPRVVSGAAGRYLQLELTGDDVARGRDLLTAALAGGTALTRAEVYDVLDRGGVRPDGQRGYHVLSRLAMDAVLCFGPARGRQATFVLLDEWVPARHELEPQEALRTIVERYFRSRGPATVRDFAGWSGLPLREVRAGIAAAAGALRAMDVAGVEHWLAADDWLTGDDAVPDADSQRAFLLPGFDEYMLGYRDRSAALAAEHADRICPGGNGVFRPTLVLDGQVRGTWKAVTTRRAVTVHAHPFRPLPRADQESFEVPARAYEAFTGVPVTLAWHDAD